MAAAELCSPPSVPRSSMLPSGVRRNARVTGRPRASVRSVWLTPTMQPRSLMSLAQLVRPPRVPRSTMPARSVHRNAWPLPPTTSLRLLIPSAMLGAAPRAPRSRMPSAAVQRNACGRPVLVSARPTTAPSSFTSCAMLVVPAPPRLPRSTMRPGSGIRKACFTTAPPIRLCPATCPRRFTASASLSFPPSVPRSKLVPTTWPARFTAFAWLTAPPSVPSSWIETTGARAASRPTGLPARRCRLSARRSAAPGWPADRCGGSQPCGRSKPDLQPGCISIATAHRLLHRQSRAGSPVARERCNRPRRPGARPSHPSVVPARSCFAPFLRGVAEPIHDHACLPAFEQLVARLTQGIARHRLRAVSRKPCGIVALCAPPARVEGRSAIRDAEECECSVLGRRQGVRLEIGRAEEQAALGVCFLDVVLQQLDLGGPDRSLLSSAGDEDAPLPAGAPHHAFDLKEIAPLWLREHRAPMGAQLGNIEPDLAQLAHHQDLEMLGSELR